MSWRKSIIIVSALALLLIVADYTSHRWTPSLPEILLGYSIIITASSILLGKKSIILVICMIALWMGVIGYLQYKQVIEPGIEWIESDMDSYDEAEYALLLGIITTVSWYANKKMSLALSRARSSEDLLKAERDSLESRIEIRTKELKVAQMEKMSQLYRFAEFGKLSSGLFHDLINPLTALSLHLHSLGQANELTLPEETRDRLAVAMGASRRMENFIKSIRKQISQQGEIVSFKAREEVHEALELLSHKALMHGIRLRFRKGPEISLLGNPLKFQQVVLNLVSNAIDAYRSTTQKEPSVWIRVAKEVEADKLFIALSVKDLAGGIDADLLSNIFEPFFTTKPPEQGSGLGLSTAKQIVEGDFGGKLSLRNRRGKGVEFIVLIPTSF